jgi:hypothetical protein
VFDYISVDPVRVAIEMQIFQISKLTRIPKNKNTLRGDKKTKILHAKQITASADKIISQIINSQESQAIDS